MIRGRLSVILMMQIKDNGQVVCHILVSQMKEVEILEMVAVQMAKNKV